MYTEFLHCQSIHQLINYICKERKAENTDQFNLQNYSTMAVETSMARGRLHNIVEGNVIKL